MTSKGLIRLVKSRRIQHVLTHGELQFEAAEYLAIAERFMIIYENYSLGMAYTTALSEVREIIMNSPVIIHTSAECIVHQWISTILHAEITDEELDKLHPIANLKFPSIAYKEFVDIWAHTESLFPGPQQWGIPNSLAKELMKFGISNEAFASPFNAHFAKYFSLFECDKRVGSLGNFLKISSRELAKLSGGWLIVPPMIEQILRDTATKISEILSACRERKIMFVCIANWTNSGGCTMLRTNRFCIHYKVLNPGQFFYQKPDGKKVDLGERGIAYMIFSSVISGSDKPTPEFIKKIERGFIAID